MAAFLPYVPALQGCYTEGSTKEEALELIEDAIKLHINIRLKKGEIIHEKCILPSLKLLYE
jgi:predicted RNase H-like HicB family nuclease